MKIVGHAGTGRYLIECTEDDLAAAAGYVRHDLEWIALKAAALPGQPSASILAKALPIGTVINASEAMRFLRTLRTKEKDAISGAAVLRALATMIEKALPTIALPNEFDEVEGDL